jgi:hypothetical protein
MWIVTNDSTGAIVAGPADAAPTAGEGETLRRVPLETRWNVQRRAFVDAARLISKAAYILLWPFNAVPLVMRTEDATMARAWALFTTMPDVINLDDPFVIAGIDRAQQIAIITTEQAQRIKDGLPPL